ncbi:nitroreductase family protein [Paludicola sp. MB14-C6]|uniref:nitroreductase family protein n=1 Tax=Paludihabitans sp. MB14-C6 TaxID=3070656 RepID=UPI0027DDA3E5|nr:nitroreductase family protein [Paludicola sp. MB14-C6]WMJ22956.1 nitroreductase family protein [Paludicola sp. MB14-C6]
MNDFYDLVMRRESCHDFLETPVEQEKLNKIIEIARLSPSACNSQPWSFVVANKPEVCSKIAPCLQDCGLNKFSENCPAFIIVIEEKVNFKTIIGGVTHNQYYAPIDLGIATAHICLAASDLGLSTCIMGWLNESKLKKLLSINQTKRIRLVIGVGYAATEEIHEKKRKSFDEIVRYIK